MDHKGIKHLVILTRDGMNGSLFGQIDNLVRYDLIAEGIGQRRCRSSARPMRCGSCDATQSLLSCLAHVDKCQPLLLQCWHHIIQRTAGLGRDGPILLIDAQHLIETLEVDNHIAVVAHANPPPRVGPVTDDAQPFGIRSCLPDDGLDLGNCRGIVDLGWMTL